MRTNLRSSLMVALAAGLVIVPLVNFAGGPHHGGRGMGKGMGMGGPGMGMGMGMHMGQRLLGPIGDQIGLTDEQKSRIQAVLDESQPRLQALRDQLTAARDAFMTDQDPTVFDEAAIRAFSASQSQIKTDLMVEVARARAEIHAVLTAEQQQQLDDLRGTCGLCGRQGGGRGARGGGRGAGAGNGTGTCPYGNS